jgi:hypothetical protein
MFLCDQEMQIILEPKKSNLAAWLAFASFLSEMGALYLFLMHKHFAVMTGLAVFGAFCLVGLVEVISSQKAVPIIIDDVAIFDPRLGLGRIYWADVQDVQTELSYRHRSICLRVDDPAKYLDKLPAARRAQVLFQQQLGFKRFTIDLRHYETDPIELKARISQHLLESRERG